MQKFTMRINVEITQGDAYNNGLRISENHEFSAADFSQLCVVLVKFHELGEAIREQKFNVRIDK